MKLFTYLGQYGVRSYDKRMKRIALVCIISAGFIYQILPQPEGVPQIDQIKTRMAAVRRQSEEVRPAVHRITAGIVQENPEVEVSTVSDSAVTEDPGFDSAASEHTDEIPWEDLKAGWRNDLKEFLIETDPDNGEEIFTAYMEESDSFEAEIDALSKEADKAGKEAKQDFENLIGQLEVRHEDKLKEILGNHYSEVTDRHQQYNSSIQYLNRSDAEVVGVSL